MKAVFGIIALMSTLGGCAHSTAVMSHLSLGSSVQPTASALQVEQSPAEIVVAAAGKPYQSGIASWYEMGTRTASGARYNPDGLSAAHPSLPFGTRLKVVNNDNGLSVELFVNDRGPYVRPRIIDVSRGAANVLKMRNSGTAHVSIFIIGDQKTADAGNLVELAD